mgnify:FL=1
MEKFAINVKIKRLSETAKIPTKAHESDAAFDIYADIQDTFVPFGKSIDESEKGIKVMPGQTVKVHTGFSTEIPIGYWGAVYARSGLATKQGLRPANCVAVIDAEYRGEWLIPLHNDSSDVQIIHHGDRIAQFMLAPVIETSFEEVSELNSSDRGEGGFGSSGK